jgi:hypothetical protein
MNFKKTAALVCVFAVAAAAAFAIDVKPGKYVAGDSRNDLDYDYFILLNANGTADIHVPEGTVNGTWSYDGYEITIKITSAQGELAEFRGQTLTFRHADGTGIVIYGEGDTFWLQ